MIARYTRPPMGRVWTDENKLAKWLEVELAACEALAECGEIPKEAAQKLRAHARVPAPERVVELEQKVRHDVIAFTLAVVENLGPEAAGAGRYFHYGLTSSDVLDTAQ
ncbi:MAG: adenylosuccinate lyase, partial [Acidobacteria bacterium]|nr:adenylosuccinate lyase [Acidobacteriota bacterium]